jgi:hypothetical protein
VSDTLATIQALVGVGDVLISAHGYDELSSDEIVTSEVLTGVARAVVVEDYPEATRGPTVLVLQRDAAGQAIHVVWGIPLLARRPAVLVTSYRPDYRRWTSDFLRRKAIEP